MKKLFYSFIGVALIVSSCSKEDDISIMTDENTRYSQSGELLTYDSCINAYVPQSFYDKPFTFVNGYIKEETPNLKSLSPGGGIMAVTEKVVRRTGSGARVQRFVSLPTGAVVTGLGLLFLSSNASVYDMLVEYSYIDANGVLSPYRYRVYAAGSRPTPVGSLEAWYSVPNGALMTGIEIGGKYDVEYMQLKYRYYNSSTHRTMGSDNSGDIVGRHPYKNPQIVFSLNDDYQNLQKHAFCGLGFGIDRGGVGVMTFELGTFI